MRVSDFLLAAVVAVVKTEINRLCREVLQLIALIEACRSTGVSFDEIAFIFSIHLLSMSVV